MTIETNLDTPYTNHIVNSAGLDLDATKSYVEAQCFPLQSILRAANLTSIDYFSLDVEGIEMEILEEFPFNDFDIKVRLYSKN